MHTPTNINNTVKIITSNSNAWVWHGTNIMMCGLHASCVWMPQGDRVENPRVLINGKPLLKYIAEKQCVREWNPFIWFRIVSSRRLL
jgi:hypothetical protein